MELRTRQGWESDDSGDLKLAVLEEVEGRGRVVAGPRRVLQARINAGADVDQWDGEASRRSTTPLRAATRAACGSCAVRVLCRVFPSSRPA